MLINRPLILLFRCQGYQLPNYYLHKFWICGTSCLSIYVITLKIFWIFFLVLGGTCCPCCMTAVADLGWPFGSVVASQYFAAIVMWNKREELELELEPHHTLLLLHREKEWLKLSYINALIQLLISFLRCSGSEASLIRKRDKRLIRKRDSSKAAKAALLLPRPSGGGDDGEAESQKTATSSMPLFLSSFFLFFFFVFQISVHNHGV